MMEGNNGRILNVPHYLNSNTRPSTEAEESDQDQMETESHAESTNLDDHGEEGIGEYDDGKTGKLTLSILLAEDLIHPGEKVMSIDYLGQTFKGDLLPIGKIRSVETGLIFNNPSAWAIYCKKIINPAKKSGCGWASVKYKGRKMDHFKNIWQRRKSQRAADDAKNEAAQILTALSTAGVGLGPQEESPLLGHSTTPGLLHSSSLNASMSNNKTTFVDLESFAAEGKMQPFTVSVSTSAMLILDLHSHLALEEVCGYLAGQWDPNSHNLAITHTFPCLNPSNDTSTETAQRIETEIYEELYGKQLTLVGWYHSNPTGPAAPR